MTQQLLAGGQQGTLTQPGAPQVHGHTPPGSVLASTVQAKLPDTGQA